MNKRSILLTIIFWAEAIIAARVLVFTMPVLVSNYARGEFNLINAHDLSVMTVTLIALYYFMTALASVLGFKGWKWFHYLGTALTIVLIFSLVKRIIEAGGSASAMIYVPIVLSCALSIFVALQKTQVQKPA